MFEQGRPPVEAACQGHLAGEGDGEAVDGLDFQAAGVVGKLPAAFFVPSPNEGAFRGIRVGQRGQHPQAHFRRRLAGEGNGQNLLGSIGPRQQAHEAADQQRGLAGTGRRLDDAGGFRAQRRGPLIGVRRGGGGRGRGAHSALGARAPTRQKDERWQLPQMY